MMLHFLYTNVAQALFATRVALAVLLLVWTSLVAAQVPSLDEARRLLREGQVDRALAAIEQRLVVDGNDRHSRFLKGVALAQKSDTNSAIEVFVALTRDYPQLPEPYNNLAVLYASQEDYQRARDALLQAINTHPSYATAHENLGDVYAKMAGLAYTRALSLDTANAVAKDKLALIDDLFGSSSASAAVTAPVKVAAIPIPVARAVSAPVPVPVKPSPAAMSSAADPVPAAATEASIAGLVDTVQSWARAWSTQDVDGYLGHYVARKSPDASLSRQAWEQRRRVRLSKPGSISINVDDFQVRRQGPEHVVVTFVQDYRSERYADRVRKSLTFKRVGKNWKISVERTIAKL
jgi:Flp pilus assembly protein TadD